MIYSTCNIRERRILREQLQAQNFGQIMVQLDLGLHLDVFQRVGQVEQLTMRQELKIMVEQLLICQLQNRLQSMVSHQTYSHHQLKF